jgi:hypothetical protein
MRPMTALSRLLPEAFWVIRDFFSWPLIAHQEFWRDTLQGLGPDPGTKNAVDAGLKWLATAQDNSASNDGGVARHYSLIKGWSTSYPETTGYIIPTLIDQAGRRQDPVLLERARRMLDWLVTIQLPCGGFQGSTIGVSPVVPVTFDTGQVLQGLAAGVTAFGDAYFPAMRRAAEWLARTQDADGCWRNPNPFVAAKNDHVYDMHAAWGLLEAARRDPGAAYEKTALRQIEWALTHQHANGWFALSCAGDPKKPLTHMLGYSLRGVLEGWRFSRDERYLVSAILAADGLISATHDNGRMPGQIDANWKGTVSWVCLTGSVQVAHCWLMLYQVTKNTKYRDAALRVNEFVRRTIRLEGSQNLIGGVKGSFPVTGNYGRFQFLNWACKFMIDANTLEEDILCEET